MSDDRVKITTRVVAAGSPAKGKVRLSITLMPERSDEAAAFSFANWPTRVREIFKSQKFALVVRRVASTADMAATDRDLLVPLPIALQDFPAGKVEDLWKEVAEKAVRCDPPWTALAKVCAIVTDVKQPPPYIKNDVPQVVGTGRSDAALSHLIHSTQRLADRLKKPSELIVKEGAGVDVSENAKKIKTFEQQGIKLDREGLERQKTKEALANGLENALKTERCETQKQIAALVAIKTAERSFPIRNLFTDEAVVGQGTPSQQIKTLYQAIQLPDAKVESRPPGALKPKTVADLADDKTGILPVDAPADTLARSFLATIRTSPMLARLFLFVVDIEMDLSSLGLKFTTSAVNSENAEAYCLLGVCSDNEMNPENTFITVTKATCRAAEVAANPAGVKLTGFWPATREELDGRIAKPPKSMAELRARGDVSQVDGVLDLGQCDGAVGVAEYNPRFDIVAIDPLLAVEATIRNDNKHIAVAQSMKRLGLTQEKTKSPFIENEPGIVSRGLAIVDRWRADAVKKEINTAKDARKDTDPKRILDADDLTLGYRIDVALRLDATEEQWRSLMEREIDYRRFGQENGSRDDMKDWFSKLSLNRDPRRKTPAELAYESDRRRDLDAATILPTARRRLVEETVQMVHAEEMIAVWEGDPLGIHCGKDEVNIRDGSDVAITRRFDLPKTKDEDNHKCWPLRYGYAYRFGIRPVWLGGVSLSLDEAKARYRCKTSGYDDLALPSCIGNALPWRRFLRFERVLPPVVLLPDAVANEKPDYAPQSALRAILRTLNFPAAGKYQDREHDSTWRVILPPQLSLDEAMRHGAFDHLADAEKTPPGGLLAIDYDSPMCASRREGSVDPDKRITAQEHSFPTQPRKGGRITDDRFRLHAKPVPASSRKSAADQYYIDPMADQLVVAIRPNNDTPGVGYFEGTPRVFDLKGEDGHPRPVALNIVRDLSKKTNARKLTQDDFWTGTLTPTPINGDDLKPASGTATIEALVATIRLQAGDSIGIDCWFVPSVQKLRTMWGWPETLALLASQKDDATLRNRQDALAKLRDLLDCKDAQAVAVKDDNAWIGMAGLPVDPVVVATAVECLHGRMLQQPVPEIAAVRTIDAVHAVARPPLQPAFDGDFAVVRTPGDTDKRAKRLEECKVWLKDPALLAANRFGERGDDGVIFAGSVRVDRDTCRQIEVRAWCVSPARTVLDDVKLGRTSLQRLLGEWPERLIPSKLVETKSTEKGPPRSKSARYLFGFDVEADGMVRLPTQPITLLRLDDLEQRAEGQKFRGNELIDLVAQQSETLKRTGKDGTIPKAGAVRATPLDLYTSRLARKIAVTLRATTRFDAYFLRLTKGEEPLPETAFPQDPAKASLVTRSSHEPDADYPTGNDSTQMRVLWIPATIAPAKPVVHAVLPSYRIVPPDTARTVTKDGMPHRYWQYRRRPALRVLLDRPWYSSGEGERLGLVLWPPLLKEITAVDGRHIDKGFVPRAVLHGDKDAVSAEPTMALNDFEDDDLGTGGQFTTRWGADPIRENAGPLGPFVPLTALVDFQSLRDRPDEASPLYVPRIDIPLNDPLDAENKSDQAKPEEGRPFRPNSNESAAGFDRLTAALLAFVPRFDVESEKWFVDVTVHADRLFEPFMRLGFVRYQPEAAEVLRVSAPVVSWAQVLPWREVEVWARRDGGAIVVTVQVSGPVSGRAGIDDDLVYPLMRIDVVERAVSAAGIADERIVQAFSSTPGGADGPLSPASIWAHCGAPLKDGSWASARPWSATFRMPVSAAGPAPRRLSILVEEIEEFLSTANERGRVVEATKPSLAAVVERQTRATDSSHAESDTAVPNHDAPDVGMRRSGPRFLARVDIDA